MNEVIYGLTPMNSAQIAAAQLSLFGVTRFSMPLLASQKYHISESRAKRKRTNPIIANRKHTWN